ncbi:MAG TPA: MipA/OmpV family protein [Desulfobulbus sp.]|nr:MipA/OmpV family protein [Desulfobulbus sp.]
MKLLSYTMIFGILITTCFATHVFSQETDSEKDGAGALVVGVGFPEDTQEFQGYIGVGAGVFPEYEGADTFTLTALPLMEIGKPGAFFLRGAGINLNDGIASAGLAVFHVSYTNNGQNAHFLMGPLLKVNIGRDEDDSDQLDGLGDIDPSIGVGGFMEVKVGSWMAGMTVAPQDAGDDNNGLLVTFDTRYVVSISNNLTIAPVMSASWADDNYMQGFFGITPTQAAHSGLSTYDAEGGIKDVGLQLHMSCDLSTHLSLKGQMGYWRLLNNAADSPIVRDAGSDNQFRALSGLTYRF